jgi:cysteine desulfurase
MSVYLDANASEPLRPEARAAMLSAADITGNPSSVHAAGRAARRILEEAREAIARSFDAAPGNVVFTSGGTESNALAVHALGRGRRLIIGATEHDAIRAACPDAAILPVDSSGLPDLSVLPRLLAEGPALLCLMLANNETGVIHPVAEAASLCREAGALLHVDAVQAAGRMHLAMAELGADSLAISSHKLGGPMGAGALLLAPHAAQAVQPLIAGGGQERGWRGGTPPLPSIAGFAAAAQLARPASVLAALRDAVEQVAIAAGARVVAAGAPRLPNTACLALPGARAETQVIALDLAGIQVSAGAACSSGKVARSHVLEAMGFGPLAGEAIRISLPWNAELELLPRFADAYQAMAARLLSRAA